MGEWDDCWYLLQVIPPFPTKHQLVDPMWSTFFSTFTKKNVEINSTKQGWNKQTSGFDSSKNQQKSAPTSVE